MDKAAALNNLSRIARVVLEIGQFSGVEPDLLRFAFAAIKRTALEQAEIVIRTAAAALLRRMRE